MEDDDNDVGEQKKGAWSSEEDELLKQLIELHGTKNWTVIANGIPGRSGKSCRLRWHNQLNPDVKKDPFTEWEDAAIVEVRGFQGAACWAP